MYEEKWTAIREVGKINVKGIMAPFSKVCDGTLAL